MWEIQETEPLFIDLAFPSKSVNPINRVNKITLIFYSNRRRLRYYCII